MDDSDHHEPRQKTQGGLLQATAAAAAAAPSACSQKPQEPPPLPETSEIQRLDEHTVRRITAEQAISDLTSIVKELLDNALDAESTTIKIRLFGQGLEIIEVSDDGTGVPVGSLPYLATRHATSKIKTLGDIYEGTGMTMGFRGEALFAMACVSDSLVVASRTEDDELATKVVYGTDGQPVAGDSGADADADATPGTHHAESPSFAPEPRQPGGQTFPKLARKVGTTVAVVKPFGNLPARRADLVRRIKQERTKLFKLVESYGVFNVGVGIRLIDMAKSSGGAVHREEVGLATSSSSRTLEETASTLLGPAFVKGMTTVEVSLESFFRKTEGSRKNDDGTCYNWGIRGLVSREHSQLAAKQRQHGGKHGSGSHQARVRSVQYYSINGRVVELPGVTALLKKLWTESLSSAKASLSSASGQYKPPKKPSAILAFTLPNDAFDINLSPDKKTVLFTHGDDLLEMVREHVSGLWGGSARSSAVFAEGSPEANLGRKTAARAIGSDRESPRSDAAAKAPPAMSEHQDVRKETQTPRIEPEATPRGDGDPGHGYESEHECQQGENGETPQHKRRFAFVHDISKAKMQHESAGRENGGRRLRRRRSTDTEATRATKTIVPPPNEPGGQNLGPPKEQFTEPSPVAAAPHPPTPEPQGESESERESPTTGEDGGDCSSTENETGHLPTSAPLDQISDSDRRKWMEVQSRFVRGDRDEDPPNGREIEDETHQSDDQHILSRSVSLGGYARNTTVETNPPVTPEEVIDASASTANTATASKTSGGDSSPPRVPSSPTRSRLDLNSHLRKFAHNASTDGAGNNNSKQNQRGGFLSQFACQASADSGVADINSSSSSSSNRNNLAHKRRRKPAVSPPDINEAPPLKSSASSRDGASKKYAAAHVNNSFAGDGKESPRVSSRKRKKRDEDESMEIETERTSPSSIAPEECNPDEGDSTTDAGTEPQVVWEAFSSTERICSDSRAERLLMRKRVQDVHGNRRLLKESISDRNSKSARQADINTKRNESSHGANASEEKDYGRDDDDEDSSSSSPFIRISKSTFRSGMQVIGQFNLGFILARCPQNHLWIMDQHACDEKYNFEQLCKKTVMHVQPLIRPLPLELNPSEEACVLDHMDVFASNGFRFRFDETAPIRHRLSLTSLPHSGAHEGRKAVAFGPSDVSALCAILTEGSSYEAGSGGTGTDGTGLYGNNAVRRHAGGSQSETPDRLLARLPKAIAMFASRACRTSIMIGTALSRKEMEAVVQKLSDTDSPWNCPHGRPTMRHVANVLPFLEEDERRAETYASLPAISVVPAEEAERES